MTSLIRWDPFAELDSFRRTMDRLLEDFMAPRLWRGEGDWSFPVDVYETDDAVMVKAALPGMRPDDVEVSVTGESLHIRGQVKQEEKTERDNYYRQEIRYGSFSRIIPLPTRVDHDKAEAEFENGVLTVKLPKAEEVRPKSIRIRVKELAGAR